MGIGHKFKFMLGTKFAAPSGVTNQRILVDVQMEMAGFDEQQKISHLRDDLDLIEPTYSGGV